jgi:hypothetical protein
MSRGNTGKIDIRDPNSKSIDSLPCFYCKGFWMNTYFCIHTCYQIRFLYHVYGNKKKNTRNRADRCGNGVDDGDSSNILNGELVGKVIRCILGERIL